MIAGLILAAGESSRMGMDKALLTYRGRTFLETILATIRGADLKRIAVVLGHHAEEIRRAVKLDSIEVVINPDYLRGQTSSLQAGLRALESDDLEAVVLCLVDHPTVAAGTVQKLLARFRQSGSRVIIPTFQGRHGHPVLISRAMLEELKDLGSDEGANGPIRGHRDDTQFVEVDDGGILLDIDDPETYRSLK